MKTLIKSNKVVQLVELDEPLCETGCVKIKVSSVGLCRTDLLVAKGIIQTQENLVLGHEFSGEVVESKSKKFKKCDKVAINPYYENGFMGLDFNGCLQEYIIVPEKQIIKNKKLSNKIAAYLEPVAASMSVLKVLKEKNVKIAIWGNNRIAELTFIILKTKGFNVDRIHDLEMENYYDYIIETIFDEVSLQKIIKMLKIDGTLIVKSRKKQLTGISASDLVKKEITLKAVNYYSFEKSMKWLENNYQKIEHLLGESYELDDWEKAFDVAEQGESKKIFINMKE